MKVMHNCLFEGITYARHTFENVGDEFKPHAHTAAQGADIHTTIVAKGSLVLMGAREGQIVKAPDFITWKIDEVHGMRSLEADTVIFNIRRTRETDREGPNKLISVPPPGT